MGQLYYSFSNEGSGRPYSNPPAGPEVAGMDSSCVVLDETKVVFASLAERFTKVPHDYAEPHLALEAFKNYFDFSDYWEPIESDEKLTPGDLYIKSQDGKKKVIVKNLTENELERDSFRSYMYTSFYQSGFKDAGFFLNGNVGADYGACIGLGYIKEGEDGLLLEAFPAEASPCGVYGEASLQVFKKPFCESAFCGLATRGKDTGEKFIYWDEDKKCIVAAGENNCREFIQKHLKEHYGDFDDVYEVRDFAATIQKNFEEVTLHVVAHLKELLEENGLHTENLCMFNGGVFNYATDVRILESGIFKNYFAPPNPSAGSGEAIGRALRRMHHSGIKLKSHRFETPFLGVTYPIEDLIYRHEILHNAKQDMTEFLQKGGVLGWYHGGAEYSVITDGHRTFLADPVKVAEENIIGKFKRRPDWQPIASIIPEELLPVVTTNECFDEIAGIVPSRPKEEWIPKMKCACADDGTYACTVCYKDRDPQLYDFLMYYYEKTGIPCLAISSLNVHGFPMVETPRDYCHLIEELEYSENTPDIKYIYVDGDDYHEVYPKKSENFG
jgi:predicted NodU family carbamoyl transferase